jgi:O-succinylbenzoic acid--CoA ligase
LLDACVARGVPVVQTYGLTEAASQVTTLAPRDAACKLGSAGKPLLTTEVRLSASDAAPAVAEVGEILVRSPTVSPGYVGQNQPSTDADGWLHTGDLGRFDEQGFLYVVGRRDELIISGGENIFPTEVEAALHAHPDVVEACVFGVPDERWGQAVAAAVQLRPGAVCIARGLQDHARRLLAGYKVPRHIRFVTDFPRTASGKLLRHRVRADATATWQRIMARTVSPTSERWD